MPAQLQQFDVLVIDFPFLDQDRVRLRPVVVISDTKFIAATGIASIAMITRLSAPEWPGDMIIGDPASAGLFKPSKVRMKFYSIVSPEVAAVGQLSTADQSALISNFRDHFGI